MILRLDNFHYLWYAFVMTTVTEDIDAKIVEAEELQKDLEIRFADILGHLNEVRREIAELSARKLALSETDFTHDPVSFKILCEKASAGVLPVFRKKVEEIIRSFPLPAGITIDHIGFTPLNSQPQLTLAFEQGRTFTDEDAAKMVEMIEFVDLSDGFREHTPVQIKERDLCAFGVFTMVFDSDGENARVYRKFFSQTTTVEDGTVAEVLTAVSSFYYHTSDSRLVDYDYEEDLED